MTSKTESWGFKSILDLLRDLGPREETRKVYKQFKALVLDAKNMSVGVQPEESRPPGCSRQTLLKTLATEGLAAALKLRQSRVLYLPSTRQEECHRKLLDLAQRMGHMMHLQEK